MYLNIAKSIIKNKIGLISKPTFVTYIITWDCNHKCIFCDVWKKDANKKDELSVAQIENAFGSIGQIDVLRITGGEPFLRADLDEVISVIHRVSNPGIIHITSNGFLTKRIISLIENFDFSEKIHIKISIDATGNRHNEIRGIKKAYENAIDTIANLARLKATKNIHFGVNQAIVNKSDIKFYFELKEVLAEFGENIPIYPSIAYDSTNSLYSGKTIVDPNNSIKFFGDFKPEDMHEFEAILKDKQKVVSDFSEYLVDKYHTTGLINRIGKNINKPNPKCVALNNHLRILPNGDIPICLYNGTIVGNIANQNFDEIWFGEEINKHRKWVGDCAGCWASCESAVSAVYTGDIIKGLFI